MNKKAIALFFVFTLAVCGLFADSLLSAEEPAQPFSDLFSAIANLWYSYLAGGLITAAFVIRLVRHIKSRDPWQNAMTEAIVFVILMVILFLAEPVAKAIYSSFANIGEDVFV